MKDIIGRTRRKLKLIVRNSLPYNLFNFLKIRSDRRQFKEWINIGKPVPPPHFVKQLAIKDYKTKYDYDTFVETGTLWGDMVQAQKKYFDEIISIELNEKLSVKAQKRFKKDRNVRIIQGDSGKVLVDVIKEINGPAIFWLDGHYSGGQTSKGDKECPIIEELEAILTDKRFIHIFLIDDARLFNGSNDYPTIEELTNFLQKKDNRYRLEIKDDIMRYYI